MSEKPAELKASRKKLDEIDEQIVTLFEKRMEISEDVARWKIANGMQVLDRKREKEKLHTLADLATSDFNRRGITELYEQIMAISRKRQYQMMDEAKALHNLPFIKVDHLVTEKTKVVYPGAAGSYSEAAMKQFFGRDIKNFSVASFRDAMTAIEEGAADYAVLPIENSTAGIVSQNYDLLNEFENYIVGEQIIPIRHCLMGVPGTTDGGAPLLAGGVHGKQRVCRAEGGRGSRHHRGRHRKPVCGRDLWPSDHQRGREPGGE